MLPEANMNQNFIMLLSSWGVLALIVLILAAYRSQLGRKEDDTIHIGADAADPSVLTQQVKTAQQIDSVERWGKTLTVVLVLYGVVLGCYYLYSFWQAQSTTVIMQ
jgi:hypothetical protein